MARVEDKGHGQSSCWDSRTKDSDGHVLRGHMEMHPVDYMSRIQPVGRGHGPYDRALYRVVSLCGPPTTSVSAPLKANDDPLGWACHPDEKPEWLKPAPNATAVAEFQPIEEFNTPGLHPSFSNINDGVLLSANLPPGPNQTMFGLVRVKWRLPARPDLPAVTVTLPQPPADKPCGGAVQITTDVPAHGADGAPLLVTFRHGTGSPPVWVDLVKYSDNDTNAGTPRTYVDSTWLGVPPPTDAVHYQVCARDAALQERCNVKTVFIHGASQSTVLQWPLRGLKHRRAELRLVQPHLQWLRSGSMRSGTVSVSAECAHAVHQW